MLLNYRNYKNVNIDFSRNVNVFMGDNAQGKTNILESIYYCGLAKSHRTSKDRELINWNEDGAYISLNIGKERLDKRIDINILKDGKKAIKVNSIKINKIGELFGTFNVVMFSPEDLKIIKESPGIRRRFIDMELCQINNRYYYNLVQYNKVLNERNTLLKNRKITDDMLDIYDEQLVNFGEYIVNERLKYIKEFNNNINDEFKEKFRSCLIKNRKRDKEKGITTVGPHRDDFMVLINNIDTKSYGSQGQQRTAVLTMKFSSLKIIKEITGEYPVLLLDDVLSELDFNRKKYILSTINNIQTIITCTGISDICEYLDNESKIFKVQEGHISS